MKLGQLHMHLTLSGCIASGNSRQLTLAEIVEIGRVRLPVCDRQVVSRKI